MGYSKSGAGFGLLKNYGFSVLLIFSILIGAWLGVVFKKDIVAVKPLGDIFLNLLFTAVVPLVFFSISSAVAGMSDARRLGRILSSMLLIFVATGIISAFLMVVGVKFYPPVAGVHPAAQAAVEMTRVKTAEQIAGAFTVPDFFHLLSKKNMLALIVFSLLIGLATLSSGEKGRPFANFLVSANEVMGKVISYIMLYAPVGLCAYFACLVGVFGPQLLGLYVRAVTLYYPVSISYFFIGFSFYAYLAGGGWAVKTFWSNIVPASLTALGTGSSVAAIPTNLAAADRIGVPKDIGRIVIPIGATIHMDGTCISAILKISLLFGFYGMDFSGLGTYAVAVAVAILSGVVMSGITGGGFLGELLIVTLYGFPPEALPMISMIGTLVDPPATLVNAVGDNVVSMVIARILGGRDWMKQNNG